MLTVILSALILTGYMCLRVYINSKKPKNCHEDYLRGSLFNPTEYHTAIFPGLIFGGIFGFVLAFLLPASYSKYEYEYKLESIKDNNSINGSFVLGTGTINNIMYYSYYYQSDENTYKLGHSNSEISVIKYSNKAPKLVKVRYECNSNIINLFAFDTGSFRRSRNQDIFYIPKNSIRNDYELNSK